MKILVIPDGQNKDDIPMDHWPLVGQYILDKKPDVIVNIGDWADMPSLSSYDKGKRCFEGRRYLKDIKAARRAMELLLNPLIEYQKTHTDYYPRLILTLGNHEDRITRLTEASPELDELVSITDLGYEDFGWTVIPFLKPIEIEGVLFCHYFYNPYNGRPLTGTMDNILKHVGKSFVAGHKQGLFTGNRFNASGQLIDGVICGSCYQHDEEYIGPQGNYYKRGILLLHNVENGSYDSMFIPLSYLFKKYNNLLQEEPHRLNYSPVLHPTHDDLQELELTLSAITKYYQQKTEALVSTIDPTKSKIVTTEICPYCTSTELTTSGYRTLADGSKKQIYKCKSCFKRHTP